MVVRFGVFRKRGRKTNYRNSADNAHTPFFTCFINTTTSPKDFGRSGKAKGPLPSARESDGAAPSPFELLTSLSSSSCEASFLIFRDMLVSDGAEKYNTRKVWKSPLFLSLIKLLTTAPTPGALLVLKHGISSSEERQFGLLIHHEVASKGIGALLLHGHCNRLSASLGEEGAEGRDDGTPRRRCHWCPDSLCGCPIRCCENQTPTTTTSVVAGRRCGGDVVQVLLLLPVPWPRHALHLSPGGSDRVLERESDGGGAVRDVHGRTVLGLPLRQFSPPGPPHRLRRWNWFPSNHHNARRRVCWLCGYLSLVSVWLVANSLRRPDQPTRTLPLPPSLPWHPVA